MRMPQKRVRNPLINPQRVNYSVINYQSIMAEISLDMGASMTPLLLSLDSYFVYIWHSYVCHLYWFTRPLPV